MRRCACHGKRWCIRCAVAYGAFLLEHFVSEKVWPLSIITHAVGL